jgi:hypothetical protein
MVAEDKEELNTEFTESGALRSRRREKTEIQGELGDFQAALE